MEIKNIAVIGSGVMGGGIAALAANCGYEVMLYDMKDKDGHLIAKHAVEKMRTAKQSPFAHDIVIEKIHCYSVEDDLLHLVKADLVIEAIVEKLDIKHKLYQDVSKFLREDALLASNTSTFKLSDLCKVLPSEVASRMSICHFFNPPVQMRLLELILHPEMHERMRSSLSRLMSNGLGKGVVICNDTPGFIANRIGCFFLELGLRKCIQYGVNICEVDKFCTEVCKLPSTGIFGLFDLIGWDVMRMISHSLTANLPNDDAYVKMYRDIPKFDEMISNGFTGRKGAGGFYRVLKSDDGKKTKQYLDLKTWEYNDTPTTVELRTISGSDNFSMCMVEIFCEFIRYVNSCLPSVTDKVKDIEQTMRMGYAWKYGPFELFDKVLGEIIEVSEFMKVNGIELAKTDPSDFKQYDMFSTEKLRNAQIIQSDKFSETLLVLDKNVRNTVFCIKTKMGTLCSQVFENLNKAIDLAESGGGKLIICGGGNYFCAGADLKAIATMVERGDFTTIEELIAFGQSVVSRLQSTKVPVIACANGIALGGGTELLLHSDHIVCTQDLRGGLVEMSVGLVPGWGGYKEMKVMDYINVTNQQGTANTKKYRNNIKAQYVSKSALDFAEKFGVDSTRMSIVPNVDLLLEHAITHSYTKRDLSRHREVDIKAILASEREEFMRRVRDPNTLGLIKNKLGM